MALGGDRRALGGFGLCVLVSASSAPKKVPGKRARRPARYIIRCRCRCRCHCHCRRHCRCRCHDMPAPASHRPPSAQLPVQLVLFKPTDLRLHDHPPLQAAHRQAAASGEAVLHVLVLDSTWYGGTHRSREAHLPRIGELRAAFLLQSVAALAEALASRGHTLLVALAPTEDVLVELGRLFDIRAVHAHGPEVCSEEQAVEKRVASQCRLVSHWGWTLTHLDDLPAWLAGGASTPERFKPFLDAVQRGKGPAVFRAPLPEPDWTAAAVPAELLAHAAARLRCGLPKLEALIGAHDAAAPFDELIATPLSVGGGGVPAGGEAAGLAALRAFVWESEAVAHYVGSSDSMSPGTRNALNCPPSRSLEPRPHVWPRAWPHPSPSRCPVPRSHLAPLALSRARMPLGAAALRRGARLRAAAAAQSLHLLGVPRARDARCATERAAQPSPLHAPPRVLMCRRLAAQTFSTSRACVGARRSSRVQGHCTRQRMRGGPTAPRPARSSVAGHWAAPATRSWTRG